MKEIYKIGAPEEFTQCEKVRFLDLLKQQGKVRNPSIERVNRCKTLCICKIENEIVSIGAIKPKTISDFGSEKADQSDLCSKFLDELGYCFTLPTHTRKGYSTQIVKQLLDKSDNINIMATTELHEDNSMKRILENKGFKKHGKIWKSSIHKGLMGLFLKFHESHETEII